MGQIKKIFTLALHGATVPKYARRGPKCARTGARSEHGQVPVAERMAGRELVERSIVGLGRYGGGGGHR